MAKWTKETLQQSRPVENIVKTAKLKLSRKIAVFDKKTGRFVEASVTLRQLPDAFDEIAFDVSAKAGNVDYKLAQIDEETGETIKTPTAIRGSGKDVPGATLEWLSSAPLPDGIDVG